VIISRAWKKLHEKKQKHFPLYARCCSWISTKTPMHLLSSFHTQFKPTTNPKTFDNRANEMCGSFEKLFAVASRLTQVQQGTTLELLPSICYDLGLSFRQALTAHGPHYKTLEKERRRTVVGEAER
jgi:hypothetical protein